MALAIAAAANGLLYVREAQRSDARLARLKSLESRWANPLMLKLAGSRPWGIGRLEHRGRRTGKLHTTPLWAQRVNEGFVIAMPYGTESYWARNLIATGEGVLHYNDVRYRVGQPRVVLVAEARPDLPTAMRVLTATLDIRNVMRVDILPALTAVVHAHA